MAIAGQGMKASSVQKALFLLLLLHSMRLPAQDKDDFILGSNQRLSDVSWKDSIYLYSTFREGKITYDRGFTPQYSWNMNYNMYYESMSFINRKGDTVLLNNPPTLKLVTLGEDIFYLDKNFGYLQVLKAGNLTLAVRHYFLLKGEEMVQGIDGSGYDERERLIHQFSDDRGKTSHFTRIYHKTTTYFFIDHYNRTYPANVATLLRSVPDHRKELRQYVSRNDPDFGKLSDLETLVGYCNSLTGSF